MTADREDPAAALAGGGPPGGAFPGAGGEMAALMRAHDWSSSPLGPPSGWPPGLGALADLVLSSRQAMFVAWGPELAFLYNDAYAPLFGARHPGALGRPFAEVWSDIWEQIGPLVDRTLAGEASWHEDLLIPLERGDRREDAWFTFSYTPVRDEGGRVAGLFCAASETTAKVLAERRAAFHLALEARLRHLSDPIEIAAAAEEALGRHLGASRVGYGVVDEGERFFTTARNWTDGTVAPQVGTHDLEAFGPEVVEALRLGRPLVIDDAAADPRTATPERLAAFRALETASVITASLVKDGRMVAALYVHDRRPRRWRADERELVQEVAERTWSAVERAWAETSLRRANGDLAEAKRAVEAERDSAEAAGARLAAEGARLRELFRQAPGFAYVWRGPEHVFEMANDAYYQLVGHRDVVGRPAREALPEVAGQGFFELADRVFATGEPFVGHAMPARLQRRPGAPLEERFVTFVLQPIRGAEGRVTGIFVQGSDVTEARQEEERRRRAEAANAHFAALVASSADGIMSFSLDGEVLSWNPGAERLFGHPAAEAVGRHVSFIVPEARSSEPGRFFARVRAGETVHFEAPRRRRDGTLFEAAVTLSPIRGPDGEVMAVSAVARDATEERRPAEALRESAERLRVAQEAGGVGTFELRADGTIAVSETFCRLWGVEPRPVVPVGELAALIHPEDGARLNTLDPGSVPTSDLGYVEYRIRRPDTGEERWMARSGQAVPGATGGPPRVIGVSYDITERKRAEEALRELNATLERRVAERTADRDRMWRLSTDIMLVARFDATITAVNPAWETLLGWPEAELLGAPFMDLVHPDDRERTRIEAGRLALGLPTHRFENRYRHKDGSHRWISWIAVPEEGLIHAVGRDVTAEREREAALRQAEDQLRQAQKLEAVGQLTGGVAHDFNNLLQALSGCLSMIGRRTDEPRVRPLLEAGRQAVDRGAKLVQQLMAFARRESLRPEPIDVRDRVLGMSALLERALRADIRLATRFGPGLWPVEVDPTQFELALINLAVNARDAMPGGGALALEAENATLGPGDPGGLEGEFVRISVSDTGTGMPPEVLARAFDPFFTTKEVGKGSGLGPAQVYGLARQGGGAARIESAPGAGTTVTLLLRRSAAPARARDEAAPPAAAGPRDARVLLVEDDPVVASTVAAALEDAGYAVARAATADEALPLLSGGERVDLVFSDMVMPGRLGGVDLAREARRLRPGLPVVLTTGYSETAAAAEGVRVLPKPYRIEELVRTLDAALAEAGRGG